MKNYGCVTFITSFNKEETAWDLRGRFDKGEVLDSAI